MDDPQLKIVDVSFGHEAVGVPLPNLSTPGALESLPKQQQQVLRIYTGYGLWQNECFQDHIQKSFQSSGLLRRLLRSIISLSKRH
jgi:hypothetical protein